MAVLAIFYCCNLRNFVCFFIYWRGVPLYENLTYIWVIYGYIYMVIYGYIWSYMVIYGLVFLQGRNVYCSKT